MILKQTGLSVRTYLKLLDFIYGDRGKKNRIYFFPHLAQGDFPESLLRDVMKFFDIKIGLKTKEAKTEYSHNESAFDDENRWSLPVVRLLSCSITPDPKGTGAGRPQADHFDVDLEVPEKIKVEFTRLSDTELVKRLMKDSPALYAMTRGDEWPLPAGFLSELHAILSGISS